MKINQETEDRLNRLVQEAVELAGGDIAAGVRLFMLRLEHDPARADDLAFMRDLVANGVIPGDASPL